LEIPARVRARFTGLLEDPLSVDRQWLEGKLFEMLADREPAPPDTVPPGDLSPEWARKLSAPFVFDPAYGTRCSTVLTLDDSLRIAERRFDPDGSPAGESEYALNAAGT